MPAALRSALGAFDVFACVRYSYTTGLSYHLQCGDSAWSGKPAGILGASSGMLGTAHAQYHLRQVFVFLNMYPLNAHVNLKLLTRSSNYTWGGWENLLLSDDCRLRAEQARAS